MKNEYYIEWTNELLDGYLSDKFTNRAPAPCELLFLSKFLRELNPEVIIDVGTWLGITGHVMGTSSKNIRQLYSIDNTDDVSFVPYFRKDIKREVKKTEYGMYLPDFAKYIGSGYENTLGDLIKRHNGNVFVFLDAKKNALLVLDEIRICYENNAQYVGLHDTSKHYKKPRRAMMKAIRDGWYTLVSEDIECAKNGISILKLHDTKEQ